MNRDAGAQSEMIPYCHIVSTLQPQPAPPPLAVAAAVDFAPLGLGSKSRVFERLGQHFKSFRNLG